MTKEQRARILALLDAGHSRDDIALETGATPNQVSAIRAHRTMGTYGARPTLSVQPHVSVLPPVHHSLAIPLGVKSTNGDAVLWDITGAANPHLLIVGESGTGKTYSIQCILRELSLHKIGALIFDFGHGFSEAFFADAQVLDLARIGVAINPLAIHHADVYGPVSVAQRIADSFVRVYPRLGIQQHAMLRAAIIDAFRDVGVTDNPRSWNVNSPTLMSLDEKLRQYATHADPTMRRTASALASHVSTLFMFNVFRPGGEQFAWDQLLHDQITILQFRGLESAVSKLVTEFLLWNLIQFAESAGAHSLRGFVVLDEAHRLSVDEGSPIEKLLREARKFGIGLILASQQPEDFSTVAISNTATKLIFQVTDIRGSFARVIGRKLHNLSWPDITVTIARLPRGQALFINKNHGSVISITPLESRGDLLVYGKDDQK